METSSIARGAFSAGEASFVPLGHLATATLGWKILCRLLYAFPCAVERGAALHAGCRLTCPAARTGAVIAKTLAFSTAHPELKQI